MSESLPPDTSSRAPFEPVEFFDDRMRSLVTEGSTVRRVGGSATWAEGPLYLAATNEVIWSDIPANRILSWKADAPDAISEWRSPSNFVNGHTLDNQGRIVHCCHGGRSVLRTEHDGSVTTLVSHFGSGRLNSPNDAVVASDDAIWFTDPPYGILSDREGYKANSELEGCFVFRLEPDTGRLDAMVTDMIHPNGLAFSPDESVLYVADTSVAVFGDQGLQPARFQHAPASARLREGHAGRDA